MIRAVSSSVKQRSTWSLRRIVRWLRIKIQAGANSAYPVFPYSSEISLIFACYNMETDTTTKETVDRD